jgi:hypothetical protein
MIEVVTHKDLQDRQLFQPKYLLKTAAGIVFLERNALLPYLANEAVATIYLHVRFYLYV